MITHIPCLGALKLISHWYSILTLVPFVVRKSLAFYKLEGTGKRNANTQIALPYSVTFTRSPSHTHTNSLSLSLSILTYSTTTIIRQTTSPKHVRQCGRLVHHMRLTWCLTRSTHFTLNTFLRNESFKGHLHDTQNIRNRHTATTTTPWGRRGRGCILRTQEDE